MAEDKGYTITDKGLEEAWKAVRALRICKEQWQNSPDSLKAKETYWNARRQLEQIVLEMFGEDWSLLEVVDLPRKV